MIVVSNTSPLIAFSRIDRLDIVHGLIPKLFIPPAVADELAVGARAGEPVVKAVEAGDWIEVRPVANAPLLAALRDEIDRGEAEAIALALQMGGTVLLDDRNGRSVAARLGVGYVGTLGILGRAKAAGIIRAVAPLVEALQRAGIYYAAQLLEQFLHAQGEG